MSFAIFKEMLLHFKVITLCHLIFGISTICIKNYFDNVLF